MTNPKPKTKPQPQPYLEEGQRVSVRLTASGKEVQRGVLLVVQQSRFLVDVDYTEVWFRRDRGGDVVGYNLGGPTGPPVAVVVVNATTPRLRHRVGMELGEQDGMLSWVQTVIC